MSESLLQYAWKNGLYDTGLLVTVSGETIQVIDPGLNNTDAGPDFFNAKIKIGGVTLAGNVEVHERASDWFRHGHDKDRAYDTVILHVVGEADVVVRETTGEEIPQFVLKIPDKLRDSIEWLLHKETAIPCLPLIGEVDPEQLTMWEESLQHERLERKVSDILSLLEQYKEDWNEVFYILLTRNFGFGTNSDAFELLAKSVPYRCILRHRHNPAQVEAMFLGQAGMLGEEEEYRFLRHKFGLHPVDATLFKNLRVRPGNFPRKRLIQLASLWTKHDTLFSRFLDVDPIVGMKQCLRTEPPLGEGSLNNLLINTVAPILFAYGKARSRPKYTERALGLMERLPPEQNKIVSMFTDAGFHVRHAGDSQALIQLKKIYCDTRKCLYCRIGFYLLRRKVEES